METFMKASCIKRKRMAKVCSKRKMEIALKALGRQTNNMGMAQSGWQMVASILAITQMDLRMELVNTCGQMVLVIKDDSRTTRLKGKANMNGVMVEFILECG
jgi:hypothetical protein